MFASSSPMTWLLCLLVFFLCCGVLFGLWDRAARRSGPRLASAGLSPTRKGTVLLVFAHPDDEAMFFAPVLETLVRRQAGQHRVCFLCLTSGNYGGLGQVRRKELVASASYFGIPPSDVYVVDDERLPDSMSTRWDPKVVAQVVERHIQSLNSSSSGGSSHGPVRTVLTFDAGGVSGHPNHIDTFLGVQVLAERRRAALLLSSNDTEPQPHRSSPSQLPAREGEYSDDVASGASSSSAALPSLLLPIRFYSLHSRPLLAKYCGVLALLPHIFPFINLFPEAASARLSASSSSKSVSKEELEQERRILRAAFHADGSGRAAEVDAEGGEGGMPAMAFPLSPSPAEQLRRRRQQQAAELKAIKKYQQGGGGAAVPANDDDSNAIDRPTRSVTRLLNRPEDDIFGASASVVVHPTRVGSSLRAMQRHASQLVWFRYLFVAFSSYTFLNEIQPLAMVSG